MGPAIIAIALAPPSSTTPPLHPARRPLLRRCAPHAQTRPSHQLQRPHRFVAHEPKVLIVLVVRDDQHDIRLRVFRKGAFLQSAQHRLKTGSDGEDESEEGERGEKAKVHVRSPMDFRCDTNLPNYFARVEDGWVETGDNKIGSVR